jgi:class 3 adenylate cyclase
MDEEIAKNPLRAQRRFESIAYQVLGTGPIDLIIAPSAISHVEVLWEEPSLVRWMERLSTFARVIHFDKRGTGMSDRVAGVATLEQRMDDIRAVMEAAGSERAALMGISEGGPMSVLFTDIVGSTQGSVELGDRRWRDLLANHHALVRKQLERFREKEMDTAGDGFFATFDGPARAIRCACAIRDEIRGLGIQVRAGLHTGECGLLGGKVGGIAVHIGARVLSQAQASEVLV